MNPSYIKVTTITITSHFGHEVDVDMVRDYFNRNEKISIKVQDKKMKFNWHLSNTVFYNQVSIYHDDHKSRKSVKLFPNGAIQVAGCSDLFDCQGVLEQVSFIVSKITKRKSEATDYTVHMINSNFSLNYYVDLNEIFETFSAKYVTTFNPDRYSAVKIKITPFKDRNVTTSIFGSGKIIVTGAKNLEEVSLVYEELLRVILSNGNILVEKSDQVEEFSMWRGKNIPKCVEKISQLVI